MIMKLITFKITENHLPQKNIDRQINEEVRKLMIALFGCLEPELISFIQSFEKMDSL